MESLFFLIPLAAIFVALALRLLFWALNSGQYDNLDTEAHRILFDNDQSLPSADSPDESPDELTNETPEKSDGDQETGEGIAQAGSVESDSSRSTRD